MSAKVTEELRARTDEQLREDLEQSHQALFNLRFQASTRQLADVSQPTRRGRRRHARLALPGLQSEGGWPWNPHRD